METVTPSWFVISVNNQLNNFIFKLMTVAVYILFIILHYFLIHTYGNVSNLFGSFAFNKVNKQTNEQVESQPLTKLAMSCVLVVGCLTTTSARGKSPSFSSFTAITAASMTSGWQRITSSSSVGDTCMFKEATNCQSTSKHFPLHSYSESSVFNTSWPRVLFSY